MVRTCIQESDEAGEISFENYPLLPPLPLPLLLAAAAGCFWLLAATAAAADSS
jgi:hypothetical protein